MIVYDTLQWAKIAYASLWQSTIRVLGTHRPSQGSCLSRGSQTTGSWAVLDPCLFTDYNKLLRHYYGLYYGTL